MRDAVEERGVSPGLTSRPSLSDDAWNHAARGDCRVSPGLTSRPSLSDYAHSLTASLFRGCRRV